MPYSIVVKKCYSVVNTKTGKVHSKCATEANAKKQIKLLYSVEKKPSKSKLLKKN